MTTLSICYTRAIMGKSGSLLVGRNRGLVLKRKLAKVVLCGIFHLDLRLKLNLLMIGPSLLSSFMVLTISGDQSLVDMAIFACLQDRARTSEKCVFLDHFNQHHYGAA